LRSRFLGFLFAAACASSCARATATAPENAAAPELSAVQEAQIGAQADRQLRREAGVLDDDALQRDVQQAEKQLAPAFGRTRSPWHTTVLDVGAPNAFALPGGYVYLTRGLLPYLSNRGQLAAVLAHEMAHVVLGDATEDYLAGFESLPADLGVFRTVARLFSTPMAPAVRRALFASHDAARERAANARAAQAVAAAGFDPSAMNVVLAALDQLDLVTDERGVPTWGMTHDRGIRLDASQLAGSSSVPSRAQVPAPSRPVEDDLVDHLRGLLFGDDPRLGLVRVNEFVAADLKIAITIPDQWDVSSDRTRMIAANPDQDAFIVLQLASRSRGRQVASLAARIAARAGLSPPVGSTIAIDGLTAFVGVSAGTLEGLGDVRARIACLRTPRGEFVVAGIADSATYPDVESQFASAIRSVRTLSDAEAGAVLPDRIELETAEPGDTWDRVARRHGGVVMGSLVAILNHAAGDRPVKAGTRIKVVVASDK
jgi:predicted Zn-dependent protease